MALIDNTTYTGKDTTGFYTKALTSGKSREYFKLIPNVKSKVKMASLNLGNIVQADSCSFSASGDATLAQKTLEVCALKLNLELCTQDFETDYLSESLKAGSNNNEVPSDFQSFMLEVIANKTSEQLGATIWSGNPDGSPVVGVCQGLLELFDNDSEVIDVLGSPVALTKATIGTALDEVYDAIPDAVRQKGAEKIKIFISTTAGALYRQYLSTNHPALIALNSGDFNLKYIDVELVEDPNMPRNVMVACVPSENIWYGTDLLSDENQIDLIDMSKTTGDDTIRFKARFKFGVNYANGSEIVYRH